MDIQAALLGAQDIDDLTYDYFKNGVQLRRQLAKEILSNTGVWADIAFLYQDWNPAAEGWKPPRITVARFRKVGGIWKKQNHLNVNGAGRADALIAVLSAWRDKVGADVRETEEG